MPPRNKHPEKIPSLAVRILRQNIVEKIQAMPGLNVAALSRTLGIPRSSLRDHLKHLEGTGQIQAKQVRGHRRIHPDGNRPTPPPAGPLAHAVRARSDGKPEPQGHAPTAPTESATIASAASMDGGGLSFTVQVPEARVPQEAGMPGHVDSEGNPVDVELHWPDLGP